MSQQANPGNSSAAPSKPAQTISLDVYSDLGQKALASIVNKYEQLLNENRNNVYQEKYYNLLVPPKHVDKFDHAIWTIHHVESDLVTNLSTLKCEDLCNSIEDVKTWLGELCKEDLINDLKSKRSELEQFRQWLVDALREAEPKQHSLIWRYMELKFGNYQGKLTNPVDASQPPLVSVKKTDRPGQSVEEIKHHCTASQLANVCQQIVAQRNQPVISPAGTVLQK